MMTNGDPEGRILMSHPHTNNGLFLLLTIKDPEVPEYAEIRHDMNIKITSLDDHVHEFQYNK